MQSSIILASTSRYRAELLHRLKINFEQHAPVCDETPLPKESPKQLVERLSATKAQSIADKFPEHLVIGSDQVASLDGRIFGKPLDHADAVAQLQALSGEMITFLTGLCLMQKSSQRMLQSIVATNVQFKKLNNAQIERYLEADKPYDCAASFRSEGYGSTIVENISSDDPTAIIGLPIILVSTYLDQLGHPLP